MAYDRRSYSGHVAYTVTLAAGISATDTALSLSDGSTFPDGSGGPFCVTVDLGNAGEEKVKIASRTGNTLTVASSGRGYDGTTAAVHAAGVKVVHTISAVDLDEANQAVVQTIGKVTTGGDLLVATGPNAFARLAIGTAGQVLTVSGGTAAWGNAAAPNLAQVEALFTADKQILSGTGNGTGELIDLLAALLEEFASAGQLIVGTGAGTGELLATGTAGQVLTVGGADPSGLQWALPSPATHAGSAQNVAIAQTGTTDLLSTASLAAGTWIVNFTASVSGSSTNPMTSISVAAGTATATLTGMTTSPGPGGATGTGFVAFTVQAVVTVPGTVKLSAVGGGLTGGYTAYDVGYTAVQVA